MVCLKLQSGLLGKIHSSFAYFNQKTKNKNKGIPNECMHIHVYRIIQTINNRKKDVTNTINNY